MSLRLISLMLFFVFITIGCVTIDEDPPLRVELPSEIKQLKYYNRYYFKSKQRTDIILKRNDMVLLFLSGAGEAITIKSNYFRTQIGDSPERRPLVNSISNFPTRTATAYAYFKAGIEGRLTLTYTGKLYNAGNSNVSKRYCRADVFVLPEEAEGDLFLILDAIKEGNKNDYFFNDMVEQFQDDYKWVLYSKINIKSSPSNAKIFLDNDYKGVTPLEIDDLMKTKTFNLCLKLNGYKDHCELFSSKSKSRFDVTLQKIKDEKGPEIVISDPIIPLDSDTITNKKPFLMVRGQVVDKSGIMGVSINGRDANLNTDGNFWLSVNLAVGKNKVKISAIDTENNVNEKSLIVHRPEIHASAQIPEKMAKISYTRSHDFGDYHGLVIGNNDYQELPQLSTAISDAKIITAILRDEYGFQTQLLLNATRAETLRAINAHRRSLGKNDNLLIYYAGHGWLDSEADQGYWLPIEAKRNDPTNWISNGTITDTLRAMDAKHVIIIADSCYSGKLARGIHIKLETNNYYNKISRKKARTVLASGGLEPVADDGGKGLHSVFASAFIEALTENQGIMDATSLFSQIRRPVMLNSDQTPEYSDIRKAGHDGGDFIFVKHLK